MMRNSYWTQLVYCCVVTLVLTRRTTTTEHRRHSYRRVPIEELSPDYWKLSAKEDLNAALNFHENKNVARNIVLFVGDGMGISSVTAARIFKGQGRGRPGEGEQLEFEKFPHVGLIKTYTVDHQIPDSAATATAFLCGVKTNYGTVGLHPTVKRKRCQGSAKHNATCILQLAQQAGKSTGLVTTARVTHATPAPLYAASPDRDWEDDSALTPEAKRHGCRDIGAQLMGPIGRELNVVLGGGRNRLMPSEQKDPEHPEQTGKRLDGRNIIDEWIQAKPCLTSNCSRYVWNSSEFQGVDPAVTDNLLGLFEPSHMEFDKDRRGDDAGDPSLADMTEKAVKILQKNRNGFFLLVEGARIDQAHHASNAVRALEDTIAMEEAVMRVMNMVSLEDTLVVVTSDHSHPLSITSYATRGNPILGKTDYGTDKGGQPYDIDGLPFTTLNYANGPSYSYPRVDLTDVDTEDRKYRQVSAVPLEVGTHEGSDVAIYATGPMAHLFGSVHEQHYIFHAMAYAACVGEDRRHCAPREYNNKLMDSSSAPASYVEVNISGAQRLDQQIILYLSASLVHVFLLFLW